MIESILLGNGAGASLEDADRRPASGQHLLSTASGRTEAPANGGPSDGYRDSGGAR